MSQIALWLCLISLLASSGCGLGHHAEQTHPLRSAVRFLAAPSRAPSTHDKLSAQGRSARGLYFSYNYVHHAGVKGIRRTLSRTRMDAAVLDIKDERGRVSYQTRVKAFKPQVVDRPLSYPRLIAKLHRAGIYTIARIPCFAEPQLSRREPERAILDVRTGRPWRSRSTGGAWLDPYNRDNHRLIVALAREAASFGFDEVQLDYIRFPVDPATEHALYPAAGERARFEVLRDLLRDIDEAIAIPLGVDVFGLTTMHEGDPSGLGQSLRDWLGHVEVISPMLYVNGMRTWARGSRHRAGLLIERLAGTLRKRIGEQTVIRPYIQAFAQGADHWNPGFITEQVASTRRAQADGYLFWHPGSDYEMVQRAARKAPEVLVPFAAASE
jgi:hypothetical protein